MNTRKLSAFAAKYKYVLIILLAGLILLLLPTGSRTKAKTAQAAAVSEQTQPHHNDRNVSFGFFHSRPPVI